jgi:hypothetical protein
MGIETQKVWEIVEKAVSHSWSVPEFQRGFVWKPVQVRDLAESLWYEYPVGSVLLWNNVGNVQERVAKDAQNNKQWVVDGQQRTTAMCIIFGRKPYWWDSAEGWDKILKKYDIRFDINAKEPPYFWTADASIKKTKGDRYIPLSKIVNLDTSKEADQKILMALSKEIKNQGLCDGMDAMEVYARLDRLRKIREEELVTVTISHELEEVVEIFARLNSRGTRVTEADIYLGIVAGKNQGFVREEFLPFLGDLKDRGFDLNPNLLFRSLTAIAAGKTRFRDISDDSVWEEKNIVPAWKKCKDAWKNLLKRLSDYGVLSNEPLPTEAALVTLIVLQNKFSDETSFDQAFYWFLQASRYGRYSSSGSTTLDEDIKEIAASNSLEDASRRLLKKLNDIQDLKPEDFLKDYSDTRFGRFMLYLLVYKNGARDWDLAGHRIGFEGNELMKDFKPQWHHIFPQKFLDKKFEEDKINSLSNISVIGPEINIRIHSKDPLDYLIRYKITPEKLKQQFVPIDRDEFKTENYLTFIEERAVTLAKESNKYLNAISKGL